MPYIALFLDKKKL